MAAKHRRILRSRNGPHRLQERPTNRGEGRQNDQHTYPATVRVLFASILFAEERLQLYSL